MRVARDQVKPPKVLQIGMRHHGLDEPLPQSFGAVLFEHVDVAEIRERRAIGDDAGKSYLFIAVEESEAQRVLDRRRHGLLRNLLCPERSTQKRMDRVDV